MKGKISKLQGVPTLNHKRLPHEYGEDYSNV